MLIDIFDAKLDWNQDYYHFCFKNCVKQILEFYGVDDARYFINTSFDFIFEKTNSGFSVKYNDGVKQAVLPAFFDKLILDYELMRDPQSIWELKKSKLKQGIPLIELVDLYYMKYHPYYQKTHRIHFVILAGYSEDEKNVYIIDWEEPQFLKTQISREEFCAAQTLEHSFYQKSFLSNAADLYWVEVEPTGWVGSRLGLLSKTLEMVLDQYYTTYVDLDDGEYYGLKALQVLRDHLKEPEIKDMESKKEIMLYINRILNPAYRSKRLFRNYLTNFADELKTPSLTNCLDSLKKVSGVWENLLFTLLKGSKIESDKEYARFLGYLDQIITIETDLYNPIYQLKKELD